MTYSCTKHKQRAQLFFLLGIPLRISYKQANPPPLNKNIERTVGSSSEFPCVLSQCTDKNPSIISSLELPWAVQDGNSCRGRYTPAPPCICLRPGQALLSLHPLPFSCPGEATLAASSAPIPDPKPCPSPLTLCQIPHSVRMSSFPLTQLREELCCGCRLPGWKSLCKARLVWAELCSNISCETRSSRATVPCGHLCKGSPVSLGNTWPGVCAKKSWLLLPMLTHGSGRWMWWLP